MSCDELVNRIDLVLSAGIFIGLFIGYLLPIIDAFATKLSKIIVGGKDV